MHADDRGNRGSALTRRAVLMGAGTAALLAAAGCRNPLTSGSGKTVTVTSTAPNAPDPIAGLIAVTRLHVLRLDAAAAVKGLTDTQSVAVKLVRDDRRAHLSALVDEQARTAGQPAPSGAPVTGTVDLQGDAKAVVGTIRADVVTGLQNMTDAVTGASKYRAALFGSIAACLASHRVVLG